MKRPKTVPKAIAPPPPSPAVAALATAYDDTDAEDASSMGGLDAPMKKKKRKKKVGGSNKVPEKVDARDFLPKEKEEDDGDSDNDNEVRNRVTVSRTAFSDRPRVQDGEDAVVVGTSLKGGTVQKVLEWIIFFEKTDSTVVDFILAFDAFVPVWKVMNILIQLYEACSFPPDRLQVAQFAHRM